MDDMKLAEIPNIDDRALMAAKEIERLQNKLFILAATPPGMPSKRRPEVLAEIKARLDKFVFELFGL